MTTGEEKNSIIGYALLVYLLFMVTLITLHPFQFRIPDKLGFVRHLYPMGFVTNIFLFIPLGFLHRLTRGKWQKTLCLREFFFGLGISLSLEIMQGFVEGRVSNGYDVIANSFGAWVGAMCFMWLRELTEKKRLSTIMALELPLVSLVYLLIPLIWLNGLAAGDEPHRLLLGALPALMGCFLMVVIVCNRLKPFKSIPVPRLALLGSGWFLLASIPALFKFPFHIVGTAAGLGVITFFLVMVSSVKRKQRISKKTKGEGNVPANEKENESKGKTTDANLPKGRCRRFELFALQRAFPVFIIYMILLFTFPSEVGLDVLLTGIPVAEEFRIALIFRFLEGIAALTLFGYMLAELRGRKQDSPEKAMGIVLVISFAVSVAALILKREGSLLLNALQLIIMTAASLYGAIIYRLQLKAIVRSYKKD